jgi:L-threonylcarbamoyladenylate synthase
MDTIRVGIQTADIVRAIEVLRQGGIIAFPTDTVYGIGAHAYMADAVERLYAAKLRPPDRAIPLLIPSVRALPQVTRSIPDEAYELAFRFWPGALTLVLYRAETVPDAVTAGGDTVAVRVPDHPVAHALLLALDVPLAATSANLSGRIPPLTAQGVLAQLEGRIDLIIDGGACPGGVPSTVLDLTARPPRIVRLGGIRAEDIEVVVPLGDAPRDEEQG